MQDIQPIAETRNPADLTPAALIDAIKAHIAEGDQARDKAEQHYIAAGQHLKRLKATHEESGGSWPEWEKLLKERVGIGKSHASALCQTADGQKSADDVRAITAERTRQSRNSSPLRSGETHKAVKSADDDVMPIEAPRRQTKLDRELDAGAFNQLRDRNS